jgi:hypothetical protein
VSERALDAEIIADAACELIAEMRATLGLRKGAQLSLAVDALATFVREWSALDTDPQGPFDDASYRALGESLDLAIHKLRASP